MPRAVLTGIRMSPRKLRLVADVVRGKHVDMALGLLKFMPQAAAPVLHKLLKSAIANAGNNHQLKADDLYVAKIMVDGGPTMRRFMARARGRACRIRKRTSQAVIVLREKFVAPKKVKGTAEAATSVANPKEGGK
ncbi:MAG: 50S ribosomal protein L22 [Candidatus Riflebacteria bacterium]|nr:50S ribosomal protein L22 [Candidatus Riflebacteria bacterium]